MTTNKLEFRALGPFGADVDGRPVAIGGPQQRRLLGTLVVNRGRVVGVDHLVDALWADGNPPSGAARSVLTYISRLRATLPDGALETVGTGYRLDAVRGWFDIDEFDRQITAAESALPDQVVSLVDAALALWRGEPFGEFAHEFWNEAETARLIERSAAAQEDRAAALLAIGHHARAIPELERLVRTHPLRERPVRLLIQALRSEDRSAEGLRAYERFRQHLADETGLEPSPELVALRDSLYLDQPNDAPAIGRPLRGYTILEAIGEGSFGRVYSATQPGTGRPVAIKAIRPDLADSSDFINRFDAEAQLVARLEHPHIVPLYDYWREPGGAYLVFRLLTGGTARDASIAQGAWSLQRVSRLVEEVGGALLAAHAMGVTHNDLTSSNVLLDDAGAAYLSDFGIASAEPTDDTVAQLGDIRALACLIWEMLAGERCRVPVGRQSDLTLPTLIGRMASAPDGLDAILARAFKGEYSTVGELILAWRAMQHRPDGALTPITSDERYLANSARRLAAGQLAMQAAAGINPYMGLRPFDEADSSGFFGRTEVVDALVERVLADRFVVVVGASGSGKSSVVRAGVVPALRALDWTIAVLTPGDDPQRALDEALVELSLRNELDTDAGGRLVSIATRTRLVLVVDQFEECWTRCSATQRDDFIASIVRAIDRPELDIRLIATIRADRFDDPLQHPELGHRIGTAAYVLSPMSPAQLDAAVVMPAARAGVVFDDGVIAELVAEAAAQPGALPLLQFTLRELYDRRVDGRIGTDQLAATGGIAGAVSRRADGIHDSLEVADQHLVRELFSRLVVPHGTDGFARRAALQSELSDGAREISGDFVDARLLVTDRDPTTREPTIEIAHDALLTSWPRLAAWVADDRRWLTQLHTISSSAVAWEHGGRSDADLLRGARLAAALEALDAGRTINPLEREFLDAGRASRDATLVQARRTTRRLRRLLVAVGATLVVALVAGTVAVVQRRDAQDASAEAEAEASRADSEAVSATEAAARADAEAAAATASAADAKASAEAATAAARDAAIEALVGRSESLRSAQRDTSALLAIEAFRAADTPRTRSALFATFTNDQRLLDTHRYEAEFPEPGIVLPDGETAYIADGTRIRPYDLDSGELGAPLEADTGGFAAGLLRASPDGSMLARLADPTTSSNPSTVVAIIDLTSGSNLFEPIQLDVWAESATFSTDGSRLLVTLGPDGRLVAFDSRTGSVVDETPGFAVDDGFPFAGGVAVLPDGRIVVSSTAGLVRLLDATTLEVLDALQVARGTTFSLRPVGDTSDQGPSVIGVGQDGSVRIGFDPMRVLWQHLDFTTSCPSPLVVESQSALYCGDFVGRLAERDLETGTQRRSLDAQNGTTGSLWLAGGGTELVAFGASEPVVSRWRLDGSGPITTVVADGTSIRDIGPDGDRLLVATTASTAMSESEVPDFTYSLVDIGSDETLADLPELVAPLFATDGYVFGAVATPDGIRVGGYDEASGRVVADGPLLDSLPTYFSGEQGKRFGLGTWVDERGATLRRIELSRSSTNGFGPELVVDGWTRSAISSSGERIAVGTVSGVRVFDGSTYELLGEIRDPLLRVVYITPTDDLFIASLGGELTQYDLDTLRPIRTFGGSRGMIDELYSSGDGSIIAVRGLDRSVTLYDTATGIQLGAPITVPEADFPIVALSLDGSRMALGGGRDNGIQVWELDPEAWVEAACRVAGRNLTTDEWQANIGDIAEYHATCPDFPADN